FIPIVNFYWLYHNMIGLCICLNEYIKRRQLNVRPCFSNIMKITCVLYNIPFLNLVLPIFTLPFAMYSVMRTARDIQMLKMHQASNSVPYPEQLKKPAPQYTYDQLSLPYIKMTILYILAYCLIFSIPAVIVSFPSGVGENFGLLVFFTSFIPLLFGLFYEIRLLYQCWDVIQDGYAWTTPDKAVQFLYYPIVLFIPIVNFYWLYHNMIGLCICLNEYIKRRQLNVRPCFSNIMKITCVLYNIPFLNLVLPIFTLPFAMYSVMRTARDIQMLKMQQL
ncbi:MAG: hypothetical protein IKS45_07560, partial [Thermoguttaceae bacterium]|nr:hypothetical protein [Thermoguttaceae bacterium]